MDIKSKRADSKRAVANRPDAEITNYVSSLSRVSEHLEEAHIASLSIDEPMLTYIVRMAIYEVGTRFAEISPIEVDKSNFTRH